MARTLPTTAAATFCATLVDEWVRAGLTHAVVSPGSRSTPLALALLQRAEVATEVVLDERSAAFVALGLARATGVPAVVLTTSGTATANLFPAVVEAHQDAVPLVLCTADRPPELHGVGAPQTIDQQHLYGDRVRRFVDAGVPEETDPGTWRALARLVWSDALGRATGEGAAPGPVQCNLPFRDPLVGAAGPLPAPSHVRLGDERVEGAGAVPVGRDGGARVLVVCGPVPGAAVAARAAAGRGWPVLVDPRVPVTGAGCVARADALLRVPAFADTARPEVVLRIGPLPASKVLGRWLDDLPAHQVGIDPWGRRFDPGGSLDQVLVADPATCLDRLTGDGPPPAGWLDRWAAAEQAAEDALAAALAGDALTEPAVARLASEVAARDDRALVVSSSMPVRDLEWYGVRGGPVFANRGANGIDGVVSTVAGVALARRRGAVGLLGDLAFLHDTNGLRALAGRGVDATLVVVDNDGGGIFHFLPQHEAVAPADFERLWGTPHGLDLVAVAQAHGVPARRVTTRAALAEALGQRDGGPAVVVVPSDRDANHAEHARLQAAIAAAVQATLEG